MRALLFGSTMEALSVGNSHIWSEIALLSTWGGIHEAPAVSGRIARTGTHSFLWMLESLLMPLAQWILKGARLP